MFYWKHAIIAAQVGIAGSTKIGKNVKIGGQVGIAGHLIIGDNVAIAGKSGVSKIFQIIKYWDFQPRYKTLEREIINSIIK